VRGNLLVHPKEKAFVNFMKGNQKQIKVIKLLANNLPENFYSNKKSKIKYLKAQ